MMKLVLPDNIFSRIFLSEINDADNLQTEFCPSAIISKRIVAEEKSVGLVPTLDLLTYKDLFVSSEVGISFNALLSNSYIIFEENQKTVGEIFLYGDVTSNEVVLSKIMLNEFYNVNVKATLLTAFPRDIKKNIMIVGDENFSKGLFSKGLSFAEEIIELISAPYVNFVLAAKNETYVKEFVSTQTGKFHTGHSESFDRIFPSLPKSSLDFLRMNVQHLIFDFEEQDLEGIRLLLQLTFFHGITDDIIDLKFV